MDTNQNIVVLQKEIRTARNEICNLRNQIKKLRHYQEKSTQDLKAMLASWQCQKCLVANACNDRPKLEDNSIVFRPIGFLSTDFPQKRAVPRQPGVCSHSRAKLTLLNTVYSNPEHALEGLTRFSHMWILFHFHRNESNHLPAKISPPRLNGEKLGVLSTRSPHRPCPIGLSLVRIDSIKGATIYFSGVDMLDGTPVIDIKPYIPQYDDPTCQSDDLKSAMVDDSSSTAIKYSGQILDEKNTAKVPLWVTKGPCVTVHLTLEAEKELRQLGKIHLKPVIMSVLKEDPRSLYIKQRYSDQLYTFLIDDLNVNCKFDDTSRTVNVFLISQANKTGQCDK